MGREAKSSITPTKSIIGRSPSGCTAEANDTMTSELPIIFVCPIGVVKNNAAILYECQLKRARDATGPWCMLTSVETKHFDNNTPN